VSLALTLAGVGFLAGLASVTFVRPRVLAALGRALPEAEPEDRARKARALGIIRVVLLLDPLVFAGIGYLAGSILGE
jgi:hypothetical protein